MGMAAAAASSSCSSSKPKNYDVFISFSGEDVRYTFLSYLSQALSRKQINVFTDESLERGEEISPSLLDVIKESRISIVIFSKNYPYSTWCLDELAQIFKCYKTMDQIVLPVFYNVDPSHVQDLEGNFRDALVMHKLKFKDSSEKVEIWRCALQEISCLSGFVSSTVKPESELIDEIAYRVSEKLRRLYSSDSQDDGFFGINWRVQRVESLLCIELIDHVRIVGIWGMGGIGKTTISDKVFNKIKNNFDSHYFVASVRETLEKRAPNDLRDEIFRKLLGEKGLEIGTPHSLETSIKRRLQCKKVLIVFDDVVDSRQLRLIVGDSGLYSPGSRIIVTSRDSQVLKNVGAKGYIYRVEGLNDSEALKLFSWHAFHQNHPKQEYMKLSQRAIQHAQGIPLVLIVLGSNLYDRTIEEWEDELEKLKSIPYVDIQEILSISYGGLERNEKGVFLDIACFFKGYNENRVKQMLKSFGFFPDSAIRRLCDKSLITCHSSRLKMHDLLEQMGREIVLQESNKMLGEQSRLWNSKDIVHVLRNNVGTAKVEGILLNMIEIDEQIEISSKAFMYMHNLRFLIVCENFSYPCGVWHSFFYEEGTKTKLCFPNGLEFLPANLRYLHWDHYPLNYLPSNFCPNNLVELHMPYSHLKELCNIDKSLKSLRCIDLRFSADLTRISDFSNASNLEVLELIGCSSLVEISWSTQAPSKLTNLDLAACAGLRRLLGIPCNIQVLILKETAIEQLPTEIGSLENLVILNLSGCSKLTSLPDAICNLKSLCQLHVSNCTNLHQLPKNLGNLQSLSILIAANIGIQELPDSINQLKQLIEFDCSGCVGLRLPPLNGLLSLRRIKLNNCYMSEFPNSLCSLTSLEEIDLGGNTFNAIPASFSKLSKLWKLDVRDCKRLEYLPGFPSKLTVLDARNCTSLKSVTSLWLWFRAHEHILSEPLCQDLIIGHINLMPAGINRLYALKKLYLRDCNRLEYLPKLPLGLEILDAANCTSLKSISTAVLPIEYLVLSNCINLKQEVSSRRIIDDVLENHVFNNEDKHKCCCLCIAGSEVPGRMMYKNNNGSSLSITFDRGDLTGFSLCAVVAHLPSNHRLIDIKCSALLTDASGCGHVQTDYFDYEFVSESGLESQSENVFLWYASKQIHIGYVSKALFEFFVEIEEKEEGESPIVVVEVEEEEKEDKPPILKCALHPIFEEHGYTDVEGEGEEHPRKRRTYHSRF